MFFFIGYNFKWFQDLRINGKNYSYEKVLEIHFW